MATYLFILAAEAALLFARSLERHFSQNLWRGSGLSCCLRLRRWVTLLPVFANRRGPLGSSRRGGALQGDC